MQTGNLSELSKDFFEVIFFHCQREVFDIYIIKDLRKFLLVLSHVLLPLAFFIILNCINGHLSIFDVFKRNEPILVRLVVLVQRYLGALHFSELWKHFVKIRDLHVFGQLLYKDVLVINLLSILAQDVSVIRQSSAGFAVNFKILELLAGLLEFLGAFNIVNFYDGRVKEPFWILLKGSWEIEDNSGFFLNDFCNLDTGAGLFG